MLALPQTPSANERVLAGFRVEVFTGETGTTLTLAQAPQASAILVWQDGLLLTPTTDWTVTGSALALTVALTGSETVVVAYWPRTGGG